MRPTPRQLRVAIGSIAFALGFSPIGAQVRSMAQDPALDNLVHPAGIQTTPWGSLGRVVRAGEGDRTLLLIPGIGFGDEVWDGVIERQKGSFHVLAVTLPGFGGTKPLPMPAGDLAPFARRAWTSSALGALAKLLDEEAPRPVTVVGQWGLGTQLALRLALDHPDRIERVVLVAGVLKVVYSSNPAMATWTLEQRAQFAEGMGLRWFRTVTRDTWDDNNFMPYDYAVNPRRGLDLWRQAQRPSLPVWIRYLLEFYTADPTAELQNLRVPTVVLQPQFDDSGFYVEDGFDYMRDLCLRSWAAIGRIEAPIALVPVPGSRLFVQYDRPEVLTEVLARPAPKH